MSIFVHEIPHEIGDFAYLMKRKFSFFSIFKTQLVTASGALIGAAISLKFGEIYKEETLVVVAASFVYFCLSLMQPEIRKICKKKSSFFGLILTIFSIATGMAIMKFMLRFE